MNSYLKNAFLTSRIPIITFGIIGNVISFIIFSRKTFRNNSISTYCQALAVSDLFIIIEYIGIVSELVYKNNFIDMNESMCKIKYFLTIQYSSIPAWILVAFSIDKMLNMKTSPPKILKSKFFQWSVVFGIFLFHFVLYSELLVTLKLVKHQKLDRYVCNFGMFDYFYPFLYAHLTESCVIPFSIMIVTSIFIIKKLKESRRSLGRIGRIANKQRKIRDMKFAISSLTFNVVFIVFKMPFLISNTISFRDFFFQVAFILFLINCSSNFLIHFATNSIFRREFFVIIKPSNRT